MISINHEIIEDHIVTGRRGSVEKGFFYRTVALRSDKVGEGIGLMKRLGIHNLSINSEWGWKAQKTDLSLVKEDSWIEGMDVIEQDLDLNFINDLPNIRRLLLPDKFKGKLDISRLPQLEVCRMKWNQKQIVNVDKARNMSCLMISRLKQEDLSVCKDLHNLEELELEYPYIVNLNGLGQQKGLRRIKIAFAMNLLAIDVLAEVQGNLKDLTIIGCKKLFNYAVLARLKELGNLVIGDGNPIPSGNFLRETKVKTGFIGVEIADKDVSELKERNIDYRKFKGYS